MQVKSLTCTQTAVCVYANDCAAVADGYGVVGALLMGSKWAVWALQTRKQKRRQASGDEH